MAVSTSMTRKVCQEVCDSLRANHNIIENSLTDSIEEALVYAKKAGLNEIIYFAHGDKVIVYNLESGAVEEKTINQL